MIARSQVPQLRVRMALLKILDAAVKDPTGLNKDRKFHVLQLRLSAAKINKYLKKEHTTCHKAKYCFVKLLCCAQAFSSCTGFSLRWLLLLQSMGSRAHAQSLWSWLPRGMWDLPRLGIDPMSSTSAGRFLTTEPPGKSKNKHF